MLESDHRESASRVVRNRLIGILVTGLAWILFFPLGEVELLIFAALFALGLFLLWGVLNRFSKTLARFYGAITLLLVVAYFSMIVIVSRQENRLKSHVGNSRNITYNVGYLPYPRIIGLDIDSNVDNEELARIFELEDLKSVKEISISSDRITDECIKVLARVLPENASLTMGGSRLSSKVENELMHLRSDCSVRLTTSGF